MKKYLFSIIYGIVLALFTAYVALDSFVLKTVPKEAAVSEEKGQKLQTQTGIEAPAPVKEDEIPEEKGKEEHPASSSRSKERRSFISGSRMAGSRRRSARCA